MRPDRSLEFRHTRNCIGSARGQKELDVRGNADGFATGGTHLGREIVFCNPHSVRSGMGKLLSDMPSEAQLAHRVP